MKFVNLYSELPKEQILKVIRDNDYVNKNVIFEKYIPEMIVRQSQRNPDKLRITCQLKNTATKDNGFLVGTYFSGKLVEKNGVTRLKGYVTTAPIYHAVMIALFVAFIVMCVVRHAFSPVPVILAVFDVVMFWREFKKQGMIERYLMRAFRKAEDYAGK